MIENIKYSYHFVSIYVVLAAMYLSRMVHVFGVTELFEAHGYYLTATLCVLVTLIVLTFMQFVCMQQTSFLRDMIVSFGVSVGCICILCFYFVYKASPLVQYQEESVLWEVADNAMQILSIAVLCITMGVAYFFSMLSCLHIIHKEDN